MAILKGDNQSNLLIGSVGNDILAGYGGNDILNGGAGNDLLNGGAGDDILIGGNGNDRLAGGGGVDVLFGGDGDDIYIIDSMGDVLFEEADEGIDTIRSPITWKLSDNIENLTLTGSGAIDGTGNALKNTLKGNNANNVLDGDAGNDFLTGGLGVDTLSGGAGNDTLKINDFNGDHIDGGTGIDSFQITADNQTLDLRNAPTIKNIEMIRLGDSHSTLIVDAKSVIGLSGDSDTLIVNATGSTNTLKMDSGWTDGGIAYGHRSFTKDGATLLVGTTINDIQILPEPTAYTISDSTTANTIGSVFDSGVQEITIDFGGIRYFEFGLDTINLIGFGLEDKLIIAQHDGYLDNGTARYNALERNHYIMESSVTKPGLRTTQYKTDKVSWQKGADIARLISAGINFRSLPTGTLAIAQFFQAIQLTGLPSGLPDSQFVFV